jgi:signal transduction histidine kinase/putative methionine-R-sulfoxide reductase with GAF domain
VPNDESRPATPGDAVTGAAHAAAPAPVPNEADRTRRERDALLQLVRDMAGRARTARDVFVHLAETAQGFTRAEGACVLELRDEVYSVIGPTGIITPYEGQSFAIMPAPSLFREVLATRDAVLTNDGQRDPRVDPRFRDALRIRQMIVVPLIVDDAIAGLVLVMNSHAPDGFDAEDVACLRRLADFGALALRDAELLRRADAAAVEARRRADEALVAGRRNAVLARSARVLASADTPDEVFAQLHAIVHAELGAGGFAIYDADADTRRVRLTFQAGVGAVDPERVAAGFWALRVADVIRSGVPLLVGDMTQGSAAELEITEPLRRDGVQGLALLPLTIGGRTVGLMSLRFLEPWAFDDAERAFLEAFAAEVAQALRNSRHLDELAARAERLAVLADAETTARRHAEAAATIARTALEAGGLRRVASSILDAILDVAPADGAALGVSRARDGRLEYVAAHGTLASLLGYRPTGTYGVAGVSGDAPSARVPSLRADAPPTAPAHLVERLPDAPALVIPLRARERAVGALVATLRGRAADDAATEATLGRLSAPLALAVDALLRDEEERARAEQQRHAEKMIALGELVAGVAHEINNPLMGITTFAELLLDEELSAEQRESVRLILSEGERASAVIRDLLLFARKAEAPVGPVEVNALVEHTLRLRRFALRSARIVVEQELAPDLPTITGSAQKLQQVLLNLVANAEYALDPARMDGRPSRRLRIATGRHADRVLLTVEDSGCGMPEAVRHRLFEPFFTTKPLGVGTGLGLSVSYGIVQSHGGTITIESAEGRGTRVTVALPASAASPDTSSP